MSLLFKRILDSDIEVLKEEILLGFSINQDDLNGVPFLFHAINTGECIVFILALFLVISTSGRSDIVKLLSEYPDLDVNKRTLNGMTPVHLAVLRNEAESVYFLGETGRVDWNIRNIFPFTSNFKFDQFIDKIGGSVLYWAIAASRGEY